MKKRRYIIMVLGMAILSIAIFYTVTFLNTNSITQEVKNLLLGEVHVDRDNPLSRYDLTDSYPEIESANVNITRLFVAHNFENGYMWVIYSYEYKDNANEVIGASTGIVSRWTIEKQNGEWKVVAIEEKP